MRQQFSTVRGLVIPVDWDESGKPIKTAIFGKDEKRYVVQPDKKGNELLRFLQEDLSVEGVIHENKAGHSVIVVENYRLALEENS